MASAWLCPLVVMLWTPGDASAAMEGPLYPDWQCPTDAMATTEPSPQYHKWAAVLSCAMLVASLCLSTFVCCCSFRWSRSHPRLATSPYVQWIQLEEFEPSAQSPSSPGPLFSPATEDPRGDPDQPPPSPIVQVHQTQAEISEEEESTPGPLVRRTAPRRAGQPGSEMEPSAEQ